MVRSKYAIVSNTQDSLVIRDTGHDSSRSVTNDVEAVVQELYQLKLIGDPIQPKRLFYYDSSGMFDEIVHDGSGQFMYFNPGTGTDDTMENNQHEIPPPND